MLSANGENHNVNPFTSPLTKRDRSCQLHTFHPSMERIFMKSELLFKTSKLILNTWTNVPTALRTLRTAPHTPSNTMQCSAPHTRHYYMADLFQTTPLNHTQLTTKRRTEHAAMLREKGITNSHSPRSPMSEADIFTDERAQNGAMSASPTENAQW